MAQSQTSYAIPRKPDGTIDESKLARNPRLYRFVTTFMPGPQVPPAPTPALEQYSADIAAARLAAGAVRRTSSRPANAPTAAVPTAARRVATTLRRTAATGGY